MLLQNHQDSLQTKQDRKEARGEMRGYLYPRSLTLTLISPHKSSQTILHPWICYIQPKSREKPNNPRRNPIETQIKNPNRIRKLQENAQISRLIGQSVDWSEAKEKLNSCWSVD
jgi:hypothetical protein